MNTEPWSIIFIPLYIVVPRGKTILSGEYALTVINLQKTTKALMKILNKEASE